MARPRKNSNVARESKNNQRWSVEICLKDGYDIEFETDMPVTVDFSQPSFTFRGEDSTEQVPTSNIYKVTNTLLEDDY